MDDSDGLCRGQFPPTRFGSDLLLCAKMQRKITMTRSSLRTMEIMTAIGILLTLLLLPESVCFGQRLDEKLAERTNFVPRSDTPLNQLIEVAQKFTIPMGIEWVEEKDGLVNESLDFQEGRIIDLIAAIIKGSPDVVANEEGEILHVFSLYAVSNPLNFLNLRIPEYEAVNRPLHLAERQLRMRINQLLYPNPKSGGTGGGYGGWHPDPLSYYNIIFSGHNVSIRDVLTGIALSCGKALWVVELSRDELGGQRPKWEGIPRDMQGQSPLSGRWKFIPLTR